MGYPSYLAINDLGEKTTTWIQINIGVVVVAYLVVAYLAIHLISHLPLCFHGSLLLPS